MAHVNVNGHEGKPRDPGSAYSAVRKDILPAFSEHLGSGWSVPTSQSYIPLLFCVTFTHNLLKIRVLCNHGRASYHAPEALCSAPKLLSPTLLAPIQCCRVSRPCLPCGSYGPWTWHPLFHSCGSYGPWTWHPLFHSRLWGVGVGIQAGITTARAKLDRATHLCEFFCASNSWTLQFVRVAG